MDADRENNAAGNGDKILNYSFVYGPVPSRRLGRSLGINNIPPKICSYSCVYCQLGKTKNIQTERRKYYNPEELVAAVKKRLGELKKRGEPLDYLAFVPDGEPTLDANLGIEIDLLKTTGVKIAVITNASLLRRKELQDELKKADWVSLKVDAFTPEVWQNINRPCKGLELDAILDGILEFSQSFEGELTTETMLVKGINDDMEEVDKISSFISELTPSISYLSTPTRPPAQKIEAVNQETIDSAYTNFRNKINSVECLTGYEGNTFSSTGIASEDLLSITAVHPMREDAVLELLGQLNAEWAIVEKLIGEGKLIEREYGDKKFYSRKLPGTS